MHQYVYLNAQRFGLFIHDFELFTDEEKSLISKAFHRLWGIFG